MTNDNPIKGSNAPKSDVTQQTNERSKRELEAQIQAKELYDLLKVSRVSSHEEITKDENLFSWQGTDFMPRQNLISLKASPKAGKTFVVTAFATAFINGYYMGLTSYSKPDDSILIVDTEQARNDTRKVLKRITKHTNVTDRISVLNVKNIASKNRLALIELEVGILRPSLIVIDGVADLIALQYNDEELAEEVITRLGKLAEDYNTTIICVIHTNKNDNNARGWLGAFLQQKCAMELSLTRKSKDDPNRILSDNGISRGKELSEIPLTIEDTDDGLGRVVIVSPDEAKRVSDELAKNKQKEKLKSCGLTAGIYNEDTLNEIIRKGYKKKTGTPTTKDDVRDVKKAALKAGALIVEDNKYIFND